MNNVAIPLPIFLQPYGKLIVFVIGQVLAALAYYYLDSATALLFIQLLTGAGVYQQPNVSVDEAMTLRANGQPRGRHRADA